MIFKVYYMVSFVQVQTRHVGEKKTVVLADLAKVEPAVRDAQQGN